MSVKNEKFVPNEEKEVSNCIPNDLVTEEAQSIDTTEPESDFNNDEEFEEVRYFLGLRIEDYRKISESDSTKEKGLLDFSNDCRTCRFCTQTYDNLACMGCIHGYPKGVFSHYLPVSKSGCYYQLVESVKSLKDIDDKAYCRYCKNRFPLVNENCEGCINYSKDRSGSDRFVVIERTDDPITYSDSNLDILFDRSKDISLPDLTPMP